MKAYTDIKQSAQLALLLPTKSADMWWSWFSDPLDDVNGGEYDKEPLLHKPVCNPKEALPCWSLVALLNVIPQEIFDGEYVVNITEGGDNRWVLTYDHCENRGHSYYGLYSGADNLIDACYEMIYKLKENELI